MNYRIGRETTDLFRAVCHEYITGIDYLDIAKYFAPSEDYSLKELQSLCTEMSNARHLMMAVRGFQEFFPNYVLSHRSNISEKTINELQFFLDIAPSHSGKTRLYHLLRLAFVIAFYQRLRNRYDGKAVVAKYIEDFNAFSEQPPCRMYFRGQSNYEYRVSPSIIRNLKESVYLNDDYYYTVLKGTAGLEDKFNNLIRRGNKKINRYNKYAFLQHSCSFSPLVDFTQNAIIATSFALSNVSRINDFRSEDSAVFCLNRTETELDTIVDRQTARDFLANEFCLKIIDSKYFKLGKDYYLKKAGSSPVLVQCSSIDDLLDALTPKIKVITIPTNDRMLYQQGLFICFYDCVCLRDYIAYELNPNFVLTKIKIPRRNKRGVLDSIYKKHREYDPEHLMNPYLYFNE